MGEISCMGNKIKIFWFVQIKKRDEIISPIMHQSFRSPLPDLKAQETLKYRLSGLGSNFDQQPYPGGHNKI